MNRYRISGIQDNSGITHWGLQKRTFIFFWRTIFKGSLDGCFAELGYLERTQDDSLHL